MKWSADVSVGFEFHTEDIEANTEEEAKDIAYELAKEAMRICDPKLRPFKVRVTGVHATEEVK